jgi:hypothetical protein
MSCRLAVIKLNIDHTIDYVFERLPGWDFRRHCAANVVEHLSSPDAVDDFFNQDPGREVYTDWRHFAQFLQDPRSGRAIEYIFAYDAARKDWFCASPRDVLAGPSFSLRLAERFAPRDEGSSNSLD